MREVDVAAGLDGHRSADNRLVLGAELVDGRIVAHHHTVEAEIATQDILQDLAIGHALDVLAVSVFHRMIAGHHGTTACQADHRLVRQQDLFHQFLVFGIATTAIAQIVLRAGTHAFLQITLLQALHEGHTHHGRQVGILAIGLLQTVEARIAAYVDHRRQRQHATHLAHRGTRLQRLLLGQLRVERACLSYLLRIDGGTTCVDTRQHLLVEEGRYAAGRIVDEPVLQGCHTVAQLVGLARYLTAILREVADAVGDDFAAFRRVQLSLLVEELVHVHTPQLGDALLLRHLRIELVHLLLQSHVGCGITSRQQCCHTHHFNSFHHCSKSYHSYVI